MSPPHATFAVDDVEPASERLEERGSLKEALQAEPLCSRLAPGVWVDASDTHALAGAVHLAFSQHRPLRLSPDMVWLTLAQGLAVHVNQNAETMRQRFVRHEGKRVLSIEADDISSAEAWEGIVDSFARELGEEMGSGVVRLLVSDFSTTTAVERMASQVVLMDTFKAYFDYEVLCICGIPSVTLTGTPEDWRKIRERAALFAEYGLTEWVQVLLPVLDQLVASAEGKPDRDFWKCLYKPAEAYGENVTTGWLQRLYPYLQSHDETYVRATFDPLAKPARSPWLHSGASLSSFPRSLSRVPIRSVGTGSERIFDLVAGFLGVAQSEDGMEVYPRIGWAVRENSLGRVIDGIVAKHRVTPVRSAETALRGPDIVPAALVALYERGDDASLFDGAMRIRPRKAIEPRSLGLFLHVYVFADLTDGSQLGYARSPDGWMSGGNLWVLRLFPGQPRETAQVVALSTLELLQRALEGAPFYFERTEFTPRAPMGPYWEREREYAPPPTLLERVGSVVKRWLK